MKIVDNEKIQVYKLELEIEQTNHMTNTYVIKDKKTSNICVIDPAFNSEKIKEKIDELQGILTLVVITHSHADHIAALAKLVENADAKVYVHTKDYDGLYDRTLNEEEIVKTKVIPVDKEKVIKIEEKQEIKLGDTTFYVLHTPGHTKGAICILDKENNILYSGDTIFENTYGRTDLITGSSEDMKNSLDKLCEAFTDILVLPGHGKEFNFKDSKRKIRLLFAFKG